MSRVRQRLEDELASLTSLRRDIHAHPESGFEEYRTSDLIAKAMTGWGIPVHRDLGKTGVVGIVRNGQSKRAIGLRSDMDALPITEQNTFAHASQHTFVREVLVEAVGEHKVHLTMS